MRINLRVDTDGASHTHFTMFVNGGNAGNLCLTREEFEQFCATLYTGLSMPEDKFELTGEEVEPLTKIYSEGMADTLAAEVQKEVERDD